MVRLSSFGGKLSVWLLQDRSMMSKTYCSESGQPPRCNLKLIQRENVVVVVLFDSPHASGMPPSLNTGTEFMKGWAPKSDYILLVSMEGISAPALGKENFRKRSPLSVAGSTIYSGNTPSFRSSRSKCILDLFDGWNAHARGRYIGGLV